MRPPIEMARQSSRNGQTVGQSQLSLSELQDLADRQRQQIFFNSQELMSKQQKFLDMQKKRIDKTSSPVQGNQDMYASLLRETYQSHMEKLKDMQILQDEADSQRFNNVELAYELERVKEIFSEKQQELASAVEKVDNLTKQLELRKKDGVANWSNTPDKLSRRRKIQAARMELDKLRNELSVRNELNGHQSKQLEMQKKVLTSKKQELDQLSEKIDVLSEQIQAQRNRAKLPPYVPRNGIKNRLPDDRMYDSPDNYQEKSHATNGYTNGIVDFNNSSDSYLSNGSRGNRAMPQINGNVFFESPKDPHLSNGSSVPYTRRAEFYGPNDGRDYQTYSNQNGKSYPSPPPYRANHRVPTPPFSPVQTSSPAMGVNPNAPKSRTDVTPQLNNNANRSPVEKLPLGAPFFSPKNGYQGARVNLESKFGSFSQSSIPPPSPTSSISSLSSLSSTHTNEDRMQHYSANIGEIKHNGILPSDQIREDDIWNDTTDFRQSRNNVQGPQLSTRIRINDAYVDSKHSKIEDLLRYRYLPYSNAKLSLVSDKLPVTKASSVDRVNNLETPEALVTSRVSSPSFPPRLVDPPIPKAKPPTPQKPKIAPKPSTIINQQKNSEQQKQEYTQKETDSIDIPTSRNDNGDETDLPPRESSPVFRKLSKEHHTFTTEQSKDHYPVAVDTNANITVIGKPPPEYTNQSYATSSFADIDKIFETQNDIIPYMINNKPNNVVGEEDVSEEEAPLAPVVISVSPEDMPPSALVKPGQDRRPKRNVELDPYALLLDSSLEGELAIVRSVLHKVPNPSLANAEGITALHNAVCGNHKEVVKFLVEIGCDINAPDNNGWTPLHCAAFYNDLELCKFLVEHGACVFAMTYSDSQTPAHKCSRLEDNYDACFKYLHDSKEQVGRISDCKVFALYDYSKQNDDELDFHCGEQMTILRRGDAEEVEWWWAKDSKGNHGYVAFNLIGLFPRTAAEV